MSLSDLFTEIYIALSANKTRSGLTILGIVIGISSVVVMMAIGTGAQLSIEESIQSIGSNLLMVYPGQQRGVGSRVNQGIGSAESLTMGDMEAIESEIANIDLVVPEASGRYQITAKSDNTNSSVKGTTADYAQMKSLEMSYGSFISDKHVVSSAKVAILGATVSETLFGEGVNPVGQKIKINSVSFSVIGVAAAKGGTSMGSEDDMVYVPLGALQKYLSGSETLSVINVEVSGDSEMDQVQSDITSLLLKRHGISDSAAADFYIFNQTDIVETAASVTGTFTLLLGAIAAISLVVGGIGIMNMMLTSVTERTREIGLRKAIGARSEYIVRQFLMEAIVLTMIGGVVGVVLAWLITWVVVNLFNYAAAVTWSSVWMAVVVSMVIGVVFGYYPAQRAAKLNPIEALRYQ
ncbi:MAG: ABC transporter permease [Patescibacteria group bacterium]